MQHVSGAAQHVQDTLPPLRITLPSDVSLTVAISARFSFFPEWIASVDHEHALPAWPCQHNPIRAVVKQDVSCGTWRESSVARWWDGDSVWVHATAEGVAASTTTAFWTLREKPFGRELRRVAKTKPAKTGVWQGLGHILVFVCHGLHALDAAS
jgi:hypothetical protein